jgi:hypothetical protein
VYRASVCPRSKFHGRHSRHSRSLHVVTVVSNHLEERKTYCRVTRVRLKVSSVCPPDSSFLQCAHAVVLIVLVKHLAAEAVVEVSRLRSGNGLALVNVARAHSGKIGLTRLKSVKLVSLTNLDPF